jgi:hypothetical protein
VGKLRKLGIDIAKSTVETYRVRPRRPSSPRWTTFLKNHMQELVALGFFVVPTVTYKVLFVLLILAHERRRVVHFNIEAVRPLPIPIGRQPSRRHPCESSVGSPVSVG